MKIQIQTIGSALLPLVFLAALWLPLMDGYFHLDPVSAPKEKRRLARMPELSLSRESIDAFPQRFDVYFRDHFGLRSSLIYANSAVKYVALGVSARRSVLIGKKGWLYSLDERSINSYRGQNPLSPEALEVRKAEKRRRALWCKDRGILYLDAWVPEKFTVYPEFLPDWVKPFSEPRNVERWTAFMKGDPEVPVLNLTESLIRNRKYHRSYYTADIHWNSYGAFAGYTAIMKQLQRQGLSAPLLSKEQLTDVRRPTKQNMADSLALDNLFGKTLVQMTPREQKSKEVKPKIPKGRDPRSYQVYAWEQKQQNLPRLVLIADSFGNEAMPFLCQSFGYVLYIRNPGWDEALIELAEPDVVVELHVARHMEEPLSTAFRPALRSAQESSEE